MSRLFSTSRLVTSVMASLLAAILLIASAPSASIAATAGSEPASRASALRCKYFAEGDTAHNYELCIKVLYRMKQDDKLIYSNFVENDTSQSSNRGNCKSTVSKTFRWGGKVSVTAEGSAWIFAKVSATVEASFDKSRTSDVSVSADFSVPPHDTVYCYYVERHEKYMTKQCFSSAQTQGRQCSRKVFYAPKREGWVISDNPIRY